MLDFRDYQIEAIEGIDQAEREGVKRPLVVHPTGTGKTVTFSGVIANRADRGRAIVLVHRQELADQAIEKLDWQAPELKTGIVKAGANDVGAQVVVASVDTIRRDNRLAEIVAADKADPFATVIVDEAHHAPAPGWSKVLKALGSFSPYGPLTAGFTATPERDGKTLGVWDKVVSYMSIREAIHRGYLVPILPAEVIETTVDLDRVGKSGGDYKAGSLGEAMEANGVLDQVADAYVQRAPERKGLAFTPTVRTAHLLAAALVARGIAAEAVDGETDPDLRKAILARLRTGETRCVVNCGVFTEGFDEPSIDLVIILRPTVFHGLYVQMVGRGTRLSPGKENLLVFDFVGATRRHELVTLVDLGLDLDGPGKKRDADGPGAPCPTCEEPCEMTHHRCDLCRRYLPKSKVAKADYRHDNCQARGSGQTDVFGSSRLRWLSVGPAHVLSIGNGVVIMVPHGPDTWKLAQYQNNRIKVLHENIPVNWAMGIGEDHAKAFQSVNERKARWLEAPVSVAQKGRLVREGLPAAKLPRIRTQGQAADLLTKITGRRAAKRLGVEL
jgi:superfamily II DNA or RNA helicase